MIRVMFGVGLLALAGLLACVHSAAPPASHVRARAVRALPLVDRMYAEIDFAGVDDPKTTLLEVLDTLTDNYGTSFDINLKAFQYEMLNDVLKTEIANPNPVPPMKARLGLVLQRMLKRIPIPPGALWMMREGHIEITSALFADAELKHRGQLGVDDTELSQLVLINPFVHADLQRRPLTEALDIVSQRTGQMIFLDESLKGELGTRPVSARFRNAPVDTAVLVLASQADLAMTRLDNVYYVTSEEKAARLEQRHDKMRPKLPPRKE